LNDPLTPTAPGEGAEQQIPELRRLGEQLAQARQRAGLSEEVLTQRLCIAPRQLKALEEGDHTHLPEGVFIVALARRVAETLHADVDEALQAVRQSRLLRPPEHATRPPSDAGPDQEISRRSPAAPGPSAMASGLAMSSPPQPQEPSTAKPPTPSPIASSDRDAGLEASGSMWRTGPSRWTFVAPLAALVVAGGLATVWLASSRPGLKRSSTTSSTSGLAPAPSSTPASSPAAADTLRLWTREPSWVEVRDVTGRTLFEGTLSGEKRFPIGSGIEVIAGRPHAVMAAVGAASGTPLGGVADIRWKRFSAMESRLDSPASPAPTP
jgi:cytoskeleton protein RodZ